MGVEVAAGLVVAFVWRFILERFCKRGVWEKVTIGHFKE